MTNLNSIFKSRGITFLTKVHIVKDMGFLVVLYGCESWTLKKAERWWIDAFELWCWRRLLRVPWTAGRSNQSILKEINPNIHWKDWYWSWSSNTFATWWQVLTHWKRPWCWVEDWRQQEKGMIENKMVGWHHWLDGHEFQQAAGVGDGQGRLECCRPLGSKDSEWLCDWTEVLLNNPIIPLYL